MDKSRGGKLLEAEKCDNILKKQRQSHYLFLFYLPFLSSIHEKANCIAILWTGRPHSLGSCLFRGFYGPPVFHIKVGRPVKCLAQGHNKRTCRLVLHNLPINAERQAGKLRMPFFKVFWYDSTRGMNPTSTDCEADALTTTPSRRCLFILRETQT